MASQLQTSLGSISISNLVGSKKRSSKQQNERKPPTQEISLLLRGNMLLWSSVLSDSPSWNVNTAMTQHGFSKEIHSCTCRGSLWVPCINLDLHRGSSVHTIHSSSRYCPVGTGLVTQLSLESVEWTNCNISQGVFNFKLFHTVSVGSFHSRDQKGESGSCDKPKLQMSAT